MSGATLGMGLVPDYAKIGVAASLRWSRCA
jgi:hypothetical protein